MDAHGIAWFVNQRTNMEAEAHLLSLLPADMAAVSARAFVAQQTHPVLGNTSA